MPLNILFNVQNRQSMFRRIFLQEDMGFTVLGFNTCEKVDYNYPDTNL